MKFIILDDEKTELLKTKKLIENYSKKNNIEINLLTYDDCNVFLTLLEKFPEDLNCDVFFLDIIMPVLGIEIAKKIKNRFRDSLIIFTTTSKEFAIDAFGVRAFNYVLKPIDEEAFDKILDEAISALSLQNQNNFVFKTDKRNIITISIENISFIESSNRRMIIHLDSGEDIYSPFLRGKFLESIPFNLEKHNFLQCHSAFIVNLNQIRTIEKNNFVLSDGTIIPISKQNYKVIKNKYLDYLAGE